MSLKYESASEPLRGITKRPADSREEERRSSAERVGFRM